MAGGRTRRPRRAVVATATATAAAVVSAWAASAVADAAAVARSAPEVAPTVGWRRAGGGWTPYESLGRTCGPPPSASPVVFTRAATCPCFLSYTVRSDGGRGGGGGGGGADTGGLGVYLMTAAAAAAWERLGHAAPPPVSLPAFSRPSLLAGGTATVHDVLLNETGDFHLVVARHRGSTACIADGKVLLEPLPTPCPVLSVDSRTAGAMQGRIVGGREATSAAERAFTVALFHDYDSEATYCGGSLIASGGAAAVLTAAHCVAGSSRPPDFVSVGGATPVSGARLRVAAVIVHPAFDAVTLRHDVAVLQLASRVSLPPAWALALDGGGGGGGGGGGDGAAAPGAVVSVTGFGARREGFWSSPARRSLRKVDLRVVTPAACAKALGHLNVVADTQLCAGGTEGCDSCQGTWRGGGGGGRTGGDWADGLVAAGDEVGRGWGGGAPRILSTGIETLTDCGLPAVLLSDGCTLALAGVLGCCSMRLGCRWRGSLCTQVIPEDRCSPARARATASNPAWCRLAWGARAPACLAVRCRGVTLVEWRCCGGSVDSVDPTALSAREDNPPRVHPATRSLT